MFVKCKISIQPDDKKYLITFKANHWGFTVKTKGDDRDIFGEAGGYRSFNRIAIDGLVA